MITETFGHLPLWLQHDKLVCSVTMSMYLFPFYETCHPHICKAGSPPSLQARLPNNNTRHSTSEIFGVNDSMPRGVRENESAERSSDLLYLHNSHEPSRNTHNTGYYWWTAGWARSRKHRWGRWKGCGWCSAARLAPCTTLGACISIKIKILLSKKLDYKKSDTHSKNSQMQMIRVCAV